ncbi:MAG: SBBP repeat-containing protein, partial [candidate division WOR-3 bacterium]
SDGASAIAVDNSGNVYVTGKSYGSGTNFDYATIKYDVNGNQLWVVRYNGPGNSSDEASAIAVDNSGNVYVTGKSVGSGTNYDYVTIKYDVNGNQLWVARYNGLGNGSDRAHDLALDNFGNVYVTGESWGPGNDGYDYATIKYNAQGTQLWVARYSSPGTVYPYDCASAIAVDNSGNVYVTGISEGSGTNFDYATIKYQEIDVGCTKILSPRGTVNQGNIVTPACSVYNYTLKTVSYTVRMKIGTSYNQTATVTNHLGGTFRYVTFPDWNVSELGNLAVSCSTELDGEINNDNDKKHLSIFVQRLDAQCVSIVQPTGMINQGTVTTPKAVIRNNSTTPQNITARFIIQDGSGYNYTVSRNLDSGQELEYTFPEWTANNLGCWPVKCSTELDDDINNLNDKQEGEIFVQHLDAQCVSIVQPTGLVNQGSVITPKAKIKNNGNTTQNITARFIIEDGSGYNHTVTQFLDPNQELEYIFPDWIANNLGSWTVKCTTELTDDMNTANDRQIGSVFIQYLDAQCVSIVQPTGPVNQGSVITPKAKIKNNGNTTQNITARFIIQDGSGYNYTSTQNLAPGQQLEYTFPDWTANNPGCWPVKCTTELTEDMDTLNDKQEGWVMVQTGGWQKLMATVPEPPSNKRVKSGGLIAKGGDKIYIVKGNNTKDFYAFVPENAPTPLDSVPVTGKKGVKKGTGMVYDGTRWLYFASGTNTLQFWKYDTQGESGWVALPDIPTGGGKALKGGTGMAYVNGFVYLLKGSKTNEFYAFDCANNTWIETLPKAPEGSYTGKGYPDGSCLVAYDENTLYALRGKYNEFYKYDISNNTWTSDSGMPFTHPMWNKKKKVGEGAAMTLRGNKIYAFKGNNTKEFWSLIPGSGWVGLETIPKGDDKKYVKGGGGLCTWTDGKIYALKGNNTTSIWRYTGEDFPLAATLPNTAPMENITGKRLSEIGLRILPNPTKGLIKVYYNLPKRELATLKIYNTLGRVVYLGRSDKGEFTIKRLPAGIYLLRFESKGYKEERKLIVVK